MTAGVQVVATLESDRRCQFQSVKDLFKGTWTPAWIEQFYRDPVNALGVFLMGCADLGTLCGCEPDLLLCDWIRGIGDCGGFAALVDESLAEWIKTSWGKRVVVGEKESEGLTAMSWIHAANVIGGENCSMNYSVVELRHRVLSDREFLEQLSPTRSQDPLGRAWVALAHNQSDHSLLDEWWRLCDLRPETEHWYRGVYGIVGLRGLQSNDPSGKCGFPQLVASGLLRFGKTLEQRSRNGVPPKNVGHNEFLRTSRITMHAYPLEWSSFWRGVRDREGGRFGGWVGELVGISRKLKPIE